MTLDELIAALKMLRLDNPEFGKLTVRVQDEDGRPHHGVQVVEVEGMNGGWLILEPLRRLDD